jgi:hypothetical protein
MSARAEPVGTVVGEVRLADHVQAGDVAHQVVVHPEPAHGVVDRWKDAHRHLVRILIRDPLVHVEQVAVALADGGFPEALDAVGKVEIDAQPAGPHPATVVAGFLGRPREMSRGARLPKLGYLRSRK